MLRVRNATDAIRERWLGPSWIIDLQSTNWHDGKSSHHVHLFITTRCISPKALLRIVPLENKWHWPRDTQFGEDAHHYAQRNGVQALDLLRTMALIVLRCNGF